MSNTEEKVQCEKVLIEFRNAVRDILKPEHDDEFLMRWLVARKWNILKAESMIRKAFKFFYNIDAEDILNNGYQPPKEMTYFPTEFWGVDYEGSPVRGILTGAMDTIGFFHSIDAIDLVKFVKYLSDADIQYAAEEAKQKKDTFIPQITYVIDYQNFAIRQIWDKQVLVKCKHILEMYQHNFPELLKTAYVINIPPLFQLVINIFSPFLDEKTFGKCKFYSTDEWKKDAFQQMDLKIVPKYYGGERNNSTCDPETYLEQTNGGKVPCTFYLKDDIYLKNLYPELTAIVIPERDLFHHNVNIQNMGALIKWVFQTKDNIRFGVSFRMSKESRNESISEEEIIESQLVESHLIPNRGELLCEKPGEYTLHFDNTYSWFMKKYLYLKVEVTQA